MKPFFIILTTLFAVKGDISHLFGNSGASNSYLPPQRQPHHRYGPPASFTPNYYNNKQRPLQQTIIRQPSKAYGAPGSSYQQPVYQQHHRPSQVSTISIQDITSSYHSQAPSFRPQTPVFHQPASAYQAPINQAPIQQIPFPAAQISQYQVPVQQIPAQRPIERPIEQYPIQRPIEQYPIQRPIEQYHSQRPIEQFPIQRPIEQFPIQRPIEQIPVQRPIERPIEQYPIQRPIEQYPIQRPIEQYHIQRPFEQFPIERPIEQFPIQRPIQQIPIQQPIHQTPIQPGSQYLPPLTSPGLTLPAPDPAPSFNPGATVAILPSASDSGLVTGKTSSSGIAITGPSAPSGNYFPPHIQQHPVNVPQTLPSGCGSCGTSLLTEGSASSGLSSILETVPGHNLGPSGYTYRQP